MVQGNTRAMRLTPNGLLIVDAYIDGVWATASVAPHWRGWEKRLERRLHKNALASKRQNQIFETAREVVEEAQR